MSPDMRGRSISDDGTDDRGDNSAGLENKKGEGRRRTGRTVLRNSKTAE